MDTQIVFAMMLSVASLCQSAKPALSEAATVSQVWSPTSRGAGVWIENRGQWPDSVRFACCVAGNSLFLESDALVVDSQHPTDAKSRVAVRLSFEDACADVIVEGVDRCDGRYSFFIGSNAEKWLRKVASFQGVRLRGIYPGIDVLMMADGSKVKYDIHVQPGADLAQMVVRLEGAAATRWSEDGTLVIETSPRSPASIGSLVHSTGVSWQTLPTGELRFVQAHWAPLCEKRFALIVPERDLSLPLVIDPELAWSTYLGSATFAGTGDVAFAVTTDSRGDVIVVGKADAFDFPHTPGAYQSLKGAEEIPFVTKFRGSDGTLIFSSLIGGSTNHQRALAVTTDDQGRVTVGGYTEASNFPTTLGAFDRFRNATNYFSGFVLQLTELGDELLYSTYIEGTKTGAEVLALADHPHEGVLVGGVAVGKGFPTTPGVFQPDYHGLFNEGFILHLNATGSALIWSTLLGGTGGEGVEGIAVDDLGRPTVAGVTGSDDFPTTPGSYQPTKHPLPVTSLFVSRLNASASTLVWSTYIGGTQSNDKHLLGGIALDASGSATIAGATNSSSFPTTAGVLGSIFPTGAISQGFVTRFDPLGEYLLYSTFLGGSLAGGVSDIVVDASGVPSLATGYGSDFPVTPGAYDTTHNGSPDGAVARIDPSGTKLLYSSFLGGPTTEGLTGISMAGNSRVTVAGYSHAPGGYPTTPNAYQPSFAGGSTDVIITSLDLVLEGIQLHGHSTPACHGDINANAGRMPSAGDPNFFLYCSGAPPLTQGFLVLGLRPVNDPVWIGGAALWVRPNFAMSRIPVTTDADGYLETTLSLVSVRAGARFAAQFLFDNPLQCQGNTSWSASNALIITVQ